VLCEDNYPANYKDCMVYKDLQKVFPRIMGKNNNIQTKITNILASIQTRPNQLGRLYTSITRTEGNQPQAKIIRL